MVQQGDSGTFAATSAVETPRLAEPLQRALFGGSALDLWCLVGVDCHGWQITRRMEFGLNADIGVKL